MRLRVHRRGGRQSPWKELKALDRVNLNAEKAVEIAVDKSAFSHWDEGLTSGLSRLLSNHGWIVFGAQMRGKFDLRNEFTWTGL
jgi:hypothetical protein